MPAPDPADYDWDMTEEEMRVYAEEERKIEEDESNKKEKEGKEEEKQETQPKRKQMAKRADCWNHFKEVLVDGRLTQGKCNYCNRCIKACLDKTGTSALKSHVSTCKYNPNNSKNQSTLQISQGESPVVHKFDPQAIRRSIAEMVIEDELPFACVEKAGFRKMMSIACPRFSMPSRRTITRDVVRIYFEERAKLKHFLKQSCERVCLTTDCWTSQQQDSYMTVTAHFIDPDWKLHKKVISFFLVKGHKGEDIGKALEQCLMEWGLDKVMTITVDNASSNDGGINFIRKKMNKSKTSIAEGKHLHMRCAAHIINLIVSDGLKELDISVKRVRAAVRFIRNGPARLKAFKKLAELEKLDTEAFLNLDVCTRWNSTYLMLKTAILYEKVFSRYEDDDPQYKQELNGEKGPGHPEEVDWENAKKMAEFLGHFYDLTLSVSATLRVTSNEFFNDIGEVKVLLQEWADSEDFLRMAMAKRMQDKYDKYWGNWNDNHMNMLIFIAAVLDPRYKLSNYTKLAIVEMFGEVNGKKVWDAVNSGLIALFQEYKALYSPNDASKQVGDTQTEATQQREGRRMQSRIAKKLKVGGEISTSKSEIEKYLQEDNEDDNMKFDILAWWKVNASRFPTLARIARDVLAIPVSTVALESAFSTSGRVLDDFRSSLTPFMVQVLVCTQDWVRRSTPINIEEDGGELAKLEKELIEEFGGANSSKSKSKSKASHSQAGSSKSVSGVSVSKPSPAS